MRNVLILLSTAALLTGCAHSIVFTSTAGSEIGRGKATGGGGGGEIVATIAGKEYKGTWIYADGGSIGTTFGNVGGVTFNGLALSSGTGQGVARLKAADGSSMRCSFTYSTTSSAGFGKCDDGIGKQYDLEIR